MPTRPAWFPLRAAIAFGCVLPLTACDQWALSIGSDGLLFISIVGGDLQLRDRFRVRTREPDGTTRLFALPASGPVTLRSAASGALEVTLLPPAGCHVAPPNPRTLTVAADQTVSVAFDVNCTG